ncbi:FAD-dependent oxidoreductase [Nocardiopsis coralliicola]
MAELPGEVEAAVVGGGLTGAAAAWELARRGREPLLLERSAAGHREGSSHGSARIVRRAYTDPFHVRATGRAMELWRELEDDAGRPLLRLTGGIDHGGAAELAATAAALQGEGVPFERLSPAAAEQRWPGFRFDGGVLFHAEAGTVDAGAAVEAFTDRAGAHGAQVHAHTPVERITVEPDAAVLHTARGTVRARRAVVAAGAWLPGLLGGLLPLPALTVTQQQVFHFPRSGLAADAPSVIHHGGAAVYSLAGGRDGGPGDARKIAEYRDPLARPTTPRDRSGTVDPRARDRVTGYVRRWLPGLEPVPFNEATCLYTSTADDEFLLDRSGPLVIASPCSGHGAKYAPLVGAWTADLAQGAAPPAPRFSLAAPRS